MPQPIKILPTDNQSVPSVVSVHTTTLIALFMTTPKKRKGKNWCSEDQVYLCRAWLSISMDPVRGADMKCETFYNAVAEAHNGNYPRDSDRIRDSDS